MSRRPAVARAVRALLGLSAFAATLYGLGLRLLGVAAAIPTACPTREDTDHE